MTTIWKTRGTQDPDTVLIAQEETIRKLALETGLSELTVRVCVQRGLNSADSIREFLSPSLEKLTSPFRIRDMDQAVARLIDAGGSSRKIRVFGDYDVDGTCGAALLGWFFRALGWSYDIRQPDRFKDGYGLNVRAVEEAGLEGVSVLVTVDCGITSFDAIQRAKDLGLEVIVVDHHQIDVARGLPNADAVIDPQRVDCESGLRQICGCGLAFYLIVALRARLREAGHAELPNLRQHLDLVVVATAADQVPLTGDNRILVRHGMDVLRVTSKPGVRALMEAAGLAARVVSPGHLGFVLGPRINASGRMQNASVALQLLLSQDMRESSELAQRLEQLNAERSEVQNKVWDEARARVEQGLSLGQFKSGIVVADPNWHEGVVGIVASRVTETFKRPAAVIAIRDGVGKGSVRSFGGKDVLEALRRSKGHLLGFGGHRHAAGFSLSPDRVSDFAAAFDSALSVLENQTDPSVLWIEGECELDSLDFLVLKELEALGPFGPGNPEPVFSVRAKGQVKQVLKGRHLKLTLTPVASRASVRNLSAIWFHAGENEEWKQSFQAPQEANWAGVPELNYFRGNVTPSFRIRDCQFRTEPGEEKGSS